VASSPETTRKPSTAWLQDAQFAGVIVADPDGWDRRNLAASMAEPITLDEFKQRLARSTHMLGAGR